MGIRSPQAGTLGLGLFVTLGINAGNSTSGAEAQGQGSRITARLKAATSHFARNRATAPAKTESLAWLGTARPKGVPLE